MRIPNTSNQGPVASAVTSTNPSCPVFGTQCGHCGWKSIGNKCIIPGSHQDPHPEEVKTTSLGTQTPDMEISPDKHSGEVDTAEERKPQSQPQQQQRFQTSWYRQSSIKIIQWDFKEAAETFIWQKFIEILWQKSTTSSPTYPQKLKVLSDTDENGHTEVITDFEIQLPSKYICHQRQSGWQSRELCPAPSSLLPHISWKSWQKQPFEDQRPTTAKYLVLEFYTDGILPVCDSIVIQVSQVIQVFF